MQELEHKYKRRTIIIGIDNRAIEMKKDFNLPIVEEKDISSLEALINSDFNTEINIPVKNIEIWKNQFLKK
jgi:hypothetical protein